MKVEPVFQVKVYGTPQQRGSKSPYVPKHKDGSLVTRPNGNPLVVVRDSNKKSGDWMTAVRQAAGEVWQGDLLDEPLILQVRFWFARPKGHYGTGRNAGRVKPSAPRRHAQEPDLSKLVRCLEDALTGVVYRDDRLIASYRRTGKAWTTGSAGAVVRIYRWADFQKEQDDAGDLFGGGGRS